LYQYIKLAHKVEGAYWDGKGGKWVLDVTNLRTNVSIKEECDILVNACGVLNSWRWPDIDGLHSFNGALIHTARWQNNIEITGKKVGLIGNG
jgi:cation diffusion facilitator CzcD-associated flavoprotein CzcO